MNESILLLLFAVVIGLAIYMLPWLLAKANGNSHSFLIFWINLLFGATGVVWVICLIWAILGPQND